jgi:hypothetical protein
MRITYNFNGQVDLVTCGPITLTMRIPLRRGSCPSLALSGWQMRLADGTVAIQPILIGTHASRIREIGALALAAATINSLRPQLNLRHRTETDDFEVAGGGRGRSPTSSV